MCVLTQISLKLFSGVRPNPNKLKAIFNAPVPSNVKQVQSFIGLCNFYSWFIPNFADYMSHLYALLHKNSVFSWGSVHQQDFDNIKKLFMNKDILCNFNPQFETSIESDASSYGLGAVFLTKILRGVRFSSLHEHLIMQSVIIVKLKENV